MFATKFIQIAQECKYAVSTSGSTEDPGTFSGVTVIEYQSQSQVTSPKHARHTQQASSSRRRELSTFPSPDDSLPLPLERIQQRYVFLLTRKASRYLFCSVDVTAMGSAEFFQTLAAKYNANRGYLRRLFSVFVYSHCDFVKIKRYAPRRFDPGLVFSYPPQENVEYTFAPKPMNEVPITRHMFYELFHTCYDDQSLLHRLHSIVSASACDILTCLPDELLECLPKRNADVSADAHLGKTVEMFWGLAAREQRSAFRVVVYMLLSMLPSVWFVFAWLFSWGHASDLQNATTPFMITCTIWGLLWAAVYSGSDEVWSSEPKAGIASD